jgi:hypothetical protein
MLDWLIKNREWLFSGLLVSVPLSIIGWWLSQQASHSSQRQSSGKNSTNIQIGGNAKLKTSVKNGKTRAKGGRQLNKRSD